MGVQILAEFRDFSVLDLKNMRPFGVEPTSGRRQAAGRMAQHSNEILGADNFSRRDGLAITFNGNSGGDDGNGVEEHPPRL